MEWLEGIPPWSSQRQPLGRSPAAVLDLRVPRLLRPSPKRGVHEEAREGRAHAAGVLEARVRPNLGADLVQLGPGRHGRGGA